MRPEDGPNEMLNEGKGAKMRRPWLQLLFVVSELMLTLIANGLLYIIISRISGSELLGAYALATSWFALFQGVSSFGVPEYLMREVGAYGRKAAPQVLHSLALGLGSGGAAFVLLLIAVHSMGYSDDIARAINIASLALIPAFLSTACRSVFMARREMHLALLALGVEVSILMTLSMAALLRGQGATVLMSSFVISKMASAAVYLALVFHFFLRPYPAFDSRLLIQTARVIFSFGIGNMLGMLTMRINIIIVSAFVGISTLGQFAAATKIMEVGLIPPAVFVQLLMSRIAYSFTAQGERDPNRFADWYLVMFALLMPMCVGGFIFARPLLEMLFGSGYGDACWILRVLMVYLLIESGDALMAVLLRVAHKQQEDMIRFALNPIVNIILSLALLPLIGPLGAAIGRVGGALASSALRHILITECLAKIDWLRFTWKPAAISVVVGAVCASLFDVDRSLWAMALYGVATMLLMRMLSGFSVHAVKDIMSAPSPGD